jgi:MinD-like ATPase involved in chromosome partitioning or flagellar assembly
MAKIISIHSFRGGTGKSNTTANVAAALAMQGKRVGVVDTDIQSPGIHVLFKMQENANVSYALNDYLWGNCEITDAAYDVTDTLGDNITGQVYVIPSSLKAGEIARILKEGYEVRRLHEGLREVSNTLELDALLIDTHPGLNEETLLSFVLSDTVGIVMRPDQQDYQGTKVTLMVARQLKVANIQLIMNKVPMQFDFDQIRAEAESIYNVEVAALLPHSDDLMVLASDGVFVAQFPEHPLSKEFRALADRLMA